MTSKPLVGLSLPRLRPAIAALILGLQGLLPTAGSAMDSPPANDPHHDRVAVMLIYFRDLNYLAVSEERAKWLSDRAADYFYEQSYGKVQLTSDVFQLYLDMDNSCDFMGLVNAAVQASKPYFDLNAYDHLVLIFPTAGMYGCGAASGASISGKWNVAGLDHPVTIAWLFGPPPHLGPLVHELGHGFGLEHAGSVNCLFSIPGLLCSDEEYGDEIDAMHNKSNGSDNPPYLGGWDKWRAGWIDEDQVETIVEPERRVYRLSRIDKPGGTKLLSILHKYVVEYFLSASRCSHSLV